MPAESSTHPHCAFNCDTVTGSSQQKVLPLPEGGALAGEGTGRQEAASIFREDPEAASLWVQP